MSRIAPWLRAVVAALTLLAPRAIRAEEPDQAPPDRAAESPNVQLGRAISFYETGRNEECAQAFGDLLGRSGVETALGRRGIERARIYYAACLIAVGKDREAEEQFRAAIRENPQIATPSPIIFPSAVIDRFLRVRSTMLEELRRAQEERAQLAREQAQREAEKAREERTRIERLEQLAAQETLIQRNRRWLATVPFGVGQFQNGDTALGALFLTTETLFAATAVTAVSVQLSLYAAAKGGTRLSQSEASEINANLRTAQTVFLASGAAFLATAAAGIVEAHLSFVPEKPAGVRKRSTEPAPAPARRALELGAAPTAGGFQVGLRGVF